MAISRKQKMFADEYLVDANATQAAIRAGYSKKTANKKGPALLSHPGIQEYLAKRMREKESSLIASQDEVLEFLTRVMRGEETEKVPVDGTSGELMDVPAGTRDRIRAAELIGKRYGTFTDRMEMEGSVGVQLIDDIGGDGDRCHGS